MTLSMNKLLNKILLVNFVILNSCTLPIELIEPRINGEKINHNFKNLTRITIDSKDNLYIADENVIKKLDTKTNELTVVAGKEKPDLYPDNEIIDGNIETAKFGTIGLIKYITDKESIYFAESFDKNTSEGKKELSFLRRIYQNKVTTLLKLETNSININSKGIIFLDVTNEVNQLIRINLDNSRKVYNVPTEEKRCLYYPDSQDQIYITCSQMGNTHFSKLYKFKDANLSLISDTRTSKSLVLDKNDDIYLVENKIELNTDGQQISPPWNIPEK